MSISHPHSRQTTGVIHVSCSLLFLLFSFGYLFMMEGELLTHAQYVFSQGVTHYSNLVGAIVITIVLQALQWLVARLVRLPVAFHALSYFPSILALTVLTDLSRQHVIEGSFAPWTWLAPLLLVLYISLVYLIKRFVTGRDLNWVSPHTLWPNYLQLFVFFTFCLLCNSADDVFMYELKTERLILEGRYEEAAQVGIESEASSPRLNNLRLFALSQIAPGQLPERIFLYPQPYGMNGLLVLGDTARSQERFTLADLTAHLGAHTDQIDMPVDRFILLARESQQAHLDSLLSVDSLTLTSLPDSLVRQHHYVVNALRREVRTMADYYLCALLLKKDLTKFIEEIPNYYPQVYDEDDAIRATLPRAYREAIAIVVPEWSDSLTLEQYGAYITMRDEQPTPRSRRNITLYQLGRSYWWYYDFASSNE